ncbi:hypothetical protein J31TS4_25220 [Paenibacillus sp. J31TS4]|uniref:FAD-dependent oxidoreductase n=1 Tax=Paenibacillus sp. J31TS4 TaxID=2807195 RepID=UPI001B21D16D|nr:FAD-dependent oxidoreductase [Paenibacillus sp. J31TS4]GIP39242.1 hypothetical protein J31TS4_25220 [Paenibacillus sp. J31TS4]
MFRNKWWILAVTFVVLLACGGGLMYYKEKHDGGLPSANVGPRQELEKVQSVSKPADRYDVIVVGTDPEGVAAAVSAARNGQKTLLVDSGERDILGGLMTLGWLNSIDLNYDVENKSTIPGVKDPILNKGIFTEWYAMVEGDSFDVNTAANAFHKLVKNEKNIDVLMKTKSIDPVVKKGAEDSVVEGVVLTMPDGSKLNVKAGAVIDATQDADFADAAGVSFTHGREDLGDSKSRMAVTAVFRLKGVTDEVWKQVRKRLSEDNNPNTDSSAMSAWGYVEMKDYPSVNPQRAKMRGLNIGRQLDDTILINALQIFGVDAFDKKSREEAFDIANKELPSILAHMKKLYPEFAGLELDGVAPELYVRESRHMQGLYRLTILDVLENRDQWDRIAFGSYAVDIQRTSPSDNGAVVLEPRRYAVPFRSIVPQKVDNLLVVGRSASYDTLPHGSARVIPTGMAEAESAGAAVKVAKDLKQTFRQLAENKDGIKQLQDLVNSKGMDLKPYTAKVQPYQQHKAYPGLKAAVYLGIATGGYNNDFKLDDPSNPQRYVNQLNIAKRVYPSAFKGDPAQSLAGMDENAKTKSALTLQQAAYTIAKAAGLTVTADKAAAELESKGLVTKATLDLIADKQNLTNGDTYLLLKDVLSRLAGAKF